MSSLLLKPLLALAIVPFIQDPALAGGGHPLVEPVLHGPSSHQPPAVYLTFDACMGAVDHRILDVLIDRKIAATFFATARWIRRNPETVAVLLAHPDLFEIENHGRDHVPAVDRPMTVYGIETAGSPAAVAAEVVGGTEAILKAGLPQPHWFRGATAKYTASAMTQIRGLGYEIAGFSLNGDAGASLNAQSAEKRLVSARDGEVIIAHVNQPTRPAGAGVAKGILELQRRGFVFRRLQDMHGQTAAH